MSTYYRPTEKIPLSDIKKLNKFEVVYDKEQDKELFFDGKNYLHFATDKDSNVIDVFRYGRNDGSFILETLEDNFGVTMTSEDEEEYSELANEETKVVTISMEVNKWKKEN